MKCPREGSPKGNQAKSFWKEEGALCWVASPELQERRDMCVCVGEGWNSALGVWCGMRPGGARATDRAWVPVLTLELLFYIGMGICERSGQGAGHQMPARARASTTNGSGSDRQDRVG